MKPGRVDQVQRDIARFPALVRCLCSVIAGVVLFAGCASVRFGSSFTEEGTAIHTLEVTVPRDAMTAVDLARVDRQIADAEINARAGGLTTVRIDNPDTVGIRVINTTEDATDTGLALNSIFNTLALDGEAGPVAPFQGTFEQVSEAVGGNSFELNLTVNGDLLYAAAANVAPGHPQFTTPAGVREVVRIEYELNMPGEITETNGGKRGEGRVHWTIPLEGPTLLYARSTVGRDTPWLWTILTIAAAFAIVTASTALVWTILLQRRRAGRSRLPLALHVSPSDAEEAGLSPIPVIDSLPALRSSLGGLVRRVLQGERLDTQQIQLAQEHTRMEHTSRGADAEGD